MYIYICVYEYEYVCIYLGVVTKSFEGHNGIDSSVTPFNADSIPGARASSRGGNSKPTSAPGSRVPTSHSQHRHGQSTHLSPTKEEEEGPEAGTAGEPFSPLFSPGPGANTAHTNTAVAAAGPHASASAVTQHSSTSASYSRPSHVEGVVMFDFSRVGT